MTISYDSDFTMTIDGKATAGPAMFDVLNPATGIAIGRAPDATQADLDAAVATARMAFPGWAAVPYAERQMLLQTVAKVLSDHADRLKHLLTAEQGKTLDDASAEIMAAAFWLEQTATLELPETVNEESAIRTSITRHVPLGVVGAIAPWNFPVLLACFKLGPALLAGNTIVLKPSPFTPLTTLKMGELLRGALPDGVLNILSGGDSLGPWMTAHPGIDKISFTGSTQTGRKVMASASDTLKRVTLELGGNDAAIVLPDVDVDAVAEQLFWSAFANSGQVCIATKRLYAHKDIYERLKQALVAYAETVTVGDGARQDSRLGPVQNRAQYERVVDLIRDAKDKGFAFVAGGLPEEQRGFFVPITILDNPPEDARIVREEQFGPVLPLLRFDDIEEVIGRANASEYGLGASIWSADPEIARGIGERLQAGTIWINEAQHLSPLAPFAGHKQSGAGAENGLEGLLEYTAAQTITVKK